MIVNENGQKSNEDIETVRKLKDELNEMSIQNIQIREMAQSSYVQQIDQLKDSAGQYADQCQKANIEILNLRSTMESQVRSLQELTAKITEQQAELTDIQKANVILRSKEINADIQKHQKEQEFTEMKEENEFLKAQVTQLIATVRNFVKLTVCTSSWMSTNQTLRWRDSPDKI